MNPRERIARLLSPLLGVLLRSRTTVKFFLTLGIFIAANYLAYLIRFEFNVPPLEMGVARVGMGRTGRVLGCLDA